MKKKFYENYVKDNEGIIIVTILSFFIVLGLLINFTKLDGGKISSNFNSRSDYCRDFHNGVLKSNTLQDSINGKSYSLNLCTDADGKVFVDELPSESILRSGDWFEKCRAERHQVHYYSEDIKLQKAVNDKNKIYICSDENGGRVLSAYMDLSGDDVKVG